MSGIARRIAAMLEPEMKPVRKPASSISRAPIPSPQPGMSLYAFLVARLQAAFGLLGCPLPPTLGPLGGVLPGVGGGGTASPPLPPPLPVHF